LDKLGQLYYIAARPGMIEMAGSFAISSFFLRLNWAGIRPP